MEIKANHYLLRGHGCCTEDAMEKLSKYFSEYEKDDFPNKCFFNTEIHIPKLELQRFDFELIPLTSEN